MNPGSFVILLSLFFTKSLCLEADPSPTSNVTVIGTVFCDACASNHFSEHSYFLEGAANETRCDFFFCFLCGLLVHGWLDSWVNCSSRCQSESAMQAEGELDERRGDEHHRREDY